MAKLEDKEAIAEEMSEVLLLVFNSYSKYPLTYLNSSGEDNEDMSMELLKTTSGKSLQEKLKKEILTVLNNY